MADAEESPDEKQCQKCGLSLVALQLPFFVKRHCVECGRETYLFDADSKNSGLRIQPGDEVQCSIVELIKGFKLKGGWRFSRCWLRPLRTIKFLPHVNTTRAPQVELLGVLDEWGKTAEAFLRASARLKPYDLETEQGCIDAASLLEEEQQLPEWSAFVLELACDRTRRALLSNYVWMAAVLPRWQQPHTRCSSLRHRSKKSFGGVILLKRCVALWARGT